MARHSHRCRSALCGGQRARAVPRTRRIRLPRAHRLTAGFRRQLSLLPNRFSQRARGRRRGLERGLPARGYQFLDPPLRAHQDPRQQGPDRRTETSPRPADRCVAVRLSICHVHNSTANVRNVDGRFGCELAVRLQDAHRHSGRQLGGGVANVNLTARDVMSRAIHAEAVRLQPL